MRINTLLFSVVIRLYSVLNSRKFVSSNTHTTKTLNHQYENALQTHYEKIAANTHYENTMITITMETLALSV
jgi:hypothetical protein